MIITYRFQTGTMNINVPEFFRLAGRLAIRKMFQQLKQDRVAAEQYVPQIWEYLREHEQKGRAEIACLAKEYMTAETSRKEAEEYYERMKSPCYACYTKDKEKVKRARNTVRETTKWSKTLKSQIVKAQKQVQRYIDIRADAVKVFGEE